MYSRLNGQSVSSDLNSVEAVSKSKERLYFIGRNAESEKRIEEKKERRYECVYVV